MTLLQLEGVARSVKLPDGSTLDILAGIDLEVSVGDHLSIVGRSGSGKTTLLNILGMLDAPTAGKVSFEGRDVRALSGRARDIARGRDIGFVFQQFNLLPGRTALENVVMPLMYSRGRTFSRRRQLAAEMLERVGLGERLGSKPDKLSGGEQQRVAIARALVRRPRLILADEPTGALDIDTGASVMTLLDEVATESGAALITITHDLHVAARARRHYRLDGGVLRPADLELAFAASTLAVDASAEAALGLTEAPTPPVVIAAGFVAVGEPELVEEAEGFVEPESQPEPEPEPEPQSEPALESQPRPEPAPEAAPTTTRAPQLPRSQAIFRPKAPPKPARAVPATGAANAPVDPAAPAESPRAPSTPEETR